MKKQSDGIPESLEDIYFKKGDQEEMQKISSQIVSVMLYAFVILGGMGILASLTRIFQHGWHPVYIGQLGIILVLLAALGLRQVLPFKILAVLLMALLFLTGVSGLFYFGLIGSSIMLLAMFSVLAGIIFGLRSGIIAAGVSLVAIIITGILTCTGVITFALLDIPSYVTSYTAWLTAIAGFLVVAGSLIVITNAIQNRLTHYMKNTSRSEEKYRDLFEEASISICEEDLTEVKKEIEILRHQGVVDFRAYFDSHPEAVANCISKIKIVDINKASLTLYEASTKIELLENFSKIFTEDALEVSGDMLVSLIEGSHIYRNEFTIRTLKGKINHVALRWVLPSRYSDTWAKIFVFLVDITKRKETEEWLRTLSLAFEQSNNAIAILDVKGTVEYANPRLLAEYNYKNEKVLGKKWQFFLSEDSTLRKKEGEIRETVLTGGRVWQEEICDTAPDGRALWRQATVFPIKNENGDVTHMVFIGEDISKRKQTEDLVRIQRDISLAFSESSNMEQLLDQLLDVAFEIEGIDAGGVYFRDMNTGELDMIVHRGLPDEFVKTASHYAADAPQTKLIMGGKPVHANYQQLGIPLDESHRKETLKAISIIPIKHEGTVIGVLNLASHTHDELPVSTRNSIEATAGMIGGLIARGRAESALSESEERYKQLVNLSPEAVVVLQDGMHKFINRAFTEIFGYDQDDVDVGLGFFQLIQEKDVDEVRRRYEARLDGNPVSRIFEIDLKAKDGSIIPCETSGTLIEHEGRPADLVTIRDISERRFAEKEKRTLRDQLHQSEKMEAIGQLAGGIAHDFNNQLAGILGFADIMRLSAEKGSEVEEYSEKIVLGVQRAADLTSQLLAFARKGKYVTMPVDVHRLIFEVVSLLDRSIDKKIVVKQHLNAGQHIAVGDASQLQNAILNLGLNARDAMPGGGELLFATDTVELDREYCNTSAFDIVPGRYLKVYVADTGTGMEEATMKRIFEPFFTTKELGRGTGMGLAAVYGTINTHKSAIEVSSEPGKGTAFTLYFPLYEDESLFVEESVKEETELRGTGNILLVDDEKFVCEISVKMLKSLGYTVTICMDGKQAAEHYKKSWKEIDLVILDLIMPELSGREVFEIIHKVNPKVKVLLSSGYSIDQEAQYLLDKGAGGFIQKPFQRSVLSKMVMEVLQKSSKK